MTTPEVPTKAGFRARAKANDVPIARLIEFETKEIAEGRAVVALVAGPQHPREPYGYAARRRSL